MQELTKPDKPVTTACYWAEIRDFSTLYDALMAPAVATFGTLLGYIRNFVKTA